MDLFVFDRAPQPLDENVVWRARRAHRRIRCSLFGMPLQKRRYFS
jgi:hypothetical protein